MDEQAIREIVRQVVARRAEASGSAERSQPTTMAGVGSHVSHYRYALAPSDGPCLIEPGVQCNHCGYCESHGH